MRIKTSKNQSLFRLKPACAALLLALTVQTAQANPIGAAVVNGQASFATTGNTLTVTNTPGAIINWQGFSINANEITRFAQQSASSAVLNRVISNNPSSILGSLQSNGRVFLVNPNGIVFGQGATVNVAGMVASTLNLSNADFLAGRYNFTNPSPTGGGVGVGVSNAGNLTAQSGGQIYLIAANVENTGIIKAPNGEILLAAGHSVELVNSNEPNLRVNITAPAGDATNVGKLVAEAGSLGLFGAVVRSSGTVSADSATLQGGKIVFKASQRTEISGTVTADGLTGGAIQALGNQVGVMDSATVTANGTQGGGTVLIGGDYQGKNPDVQNAQVTYVAPTATIRADATDTGDGGMVIVWADDTTRAYGSISARGGNNGGNGGFVETSGHKYLDFQGWVDTQAPHGKVGTLLLDPTSIYIATNQANATTAGMAGTDTSVDGVTVFTPASTAVADSLLTVATLQTVLGSSAVNVTTANVSGTGNGDIFVVDPVTWANANTLTLSASNNIAINAALTGTSGGIVLNAPTGTISAPAAVISANTLQVTSSGAASFAALNQVNTLAASVTTGIFTFENALPAGLTIGTVGAMNGVSASGAITIRQNTSGGITVNQSVASSAGDVMLGIASGTGSITTGAIVSGLNTQVYTSGGNITVNASLTAATGTATLDAGLGTGTITGTGQINANAINLQATTYNANGVGAIGTFGAPLKTASIGSGNAAISIGVDAAGPSAVYLNHTGDATLLGVSMGTFPSAPGPKPVDISASGNLTATSIDTGLANMSLSAGAGGKLTIPAGTTLSGANITLVADLMDIQSNPQLPSSIDTGAGLLWLHPITAGCNIDLGSATDLAANTLELSTIELDTLIGSGTLRIGHSASGNIFLSGPVFPVGFNTGTLSLWSGGTVTQTTAADIITASKLAIKATGNVILDTAQNLVTDLAAQVSGGASNFSFKNAGALNIAANIDGLSGISMPGFVNPDGAITLISGGPLTQSAGALLAGSAVYAEGSKVILTNANPTGVIAGKSTVAATGDIFSYTSSNSIMVTTVNGFGGIQTAAPPDAISVLLSAGNAGIGQDQPIIAGVGTKGLSLTTTGPVGLNAANSVGALTAVGVGGLSFTNIGALTVGVAGNGVTTTTNQPIAINASGTLTVQDPVNAGTGNLSLYGSSIYLGSAAPAMVTGGSTQFYASQLDGIVSQFAGGTVSATNGLSINADNISFGGTILGALPGGVGGVDILPFTAGRAVEIAGALATVGTLSITQADLAAINPPGSGIVGGVWGPISPTGTVTFKGNFTPPGGMGTGIYGSAISQSSGTTINGALAVTATGPVTLTEPTNQITSMGSQFTSTSSINVVTNVPSLSLWGGTQGDLIAGAGGLSVTNIGGNIVVDSIVVAPTINFQSASGITLGAASSLTAGGVATIVLNAGTGNFVNNSSAGAAALSAPSSRWLVYAAAPSSVIKGGLASAFRHYNGTYSTYAPGSVTETGNGFIYASAPDTLYINTTLSSGTASNTYGTAPTAKFGYTIVNPTTADNEDLALIAGTPAFTPTLSSITPAGSYTVYYSGGLTSAAGYTFVGNAGIAYKVNPKLLTLITAALTGTASKVYDGTTDAPLTSDNFLLSGFVNPADSATVTKTTGTYASLNVGSGIMVSTTLASSDFRSVGITNLANYILPTSASGLIGSITVRPLSIWSGLGGDSLWSNPANWDALPDGNNVLAVNIPAGGSVTFDGAVALQAISSKGSMALNGNNLSIGSFTQTGGSLTGSGNLNVANDFSQAGGTITLSGAASANITQSTGNLNIANLSAPTVNLTASMGAITQTGPIIAATLATTSAAGTLLNNTGNRIGSFSANNSGSGNVELTNKSSPLLITGIINTGGDIRVDNTGATATNSKKVKASGVVSIKAHSPLSIGSGGIEAGGNITLTAGVAGSPAAEDIITLNGAVSGSSIVLAAHSVAGTVPAPAGATLQIYTEPAAPVAAIPAIIDTLVSNIVVLPPSLPFSPPTPPALMQTPPADATTSDEKKKDAQSAKQDVVALAAEPAPAAAPMPVCK